MRSIMNFINQKSALSALFIASSLLFSSAASAVINLGCSIEKKSDTCSKEIGGLFFRNFSVAVVGKGIVTFNVRDQNGKLLLRKSNLSVMNKTLGFAGSGVITSTKVKLNADRIDKGVALILG